MKYSSSPPSLSIHRTRAYVGVYSSRRLCEYTASRVYRETRRRDRRRTSDRYRQLPVRRNGSPQSVKTAGHPPANFLLRSRTGSCNNQPRARRTGSRRLSTAVTPRGVMTIQVTRVRSSSLSLLTASLSLPSVKFTRRVSYTL